MEKNVKIVTPKASKSETNQTYTANEQPQRNQTIQLCAFSKKNQINRTIRISFMSKKKEIYNFNFDFTTHLFKIFEQE